MEYRVKVVPNSRKEGVEELKDGRLQVSVRADRKRGAANERMRVVLAAHLGVSAERVALVSGHTSPTKTVRVKAK